MANEYSATWFERFLRPISAVQTEAEAAFLARQLPQPDYSRLLDIACGEGRHALALARRGYQVVGVDREPAALALATRTVGPTATFVEQDMRDLRRLCGTFDAAMVLWQSFGYFDDLTNLDILLQIRDKLAHHGRLILDVYHRGFFERHQGTRTMAGPGSTTRERKYMDGQRLIVELDYGSGGEADRFEWRLYTPDELGLLATELGYRCLLICSGFDEALPATASSPRMQLVFQRQD
jgi:SAM-dependent methyltransferase